MSKVYEFNGNDYIKYVIDENEIDQDEMHTLLVFINSHKNIYLYGNGLCGQGFGAFANKSGFGNIKGYITSETLDDFFAHYDSGKDGVILTLKSDYYAEIMPMLFNRIAVEDILFLSEKTKRKFMLPFSDEYIKNNFWLTLVVSKNCNINCTSCSMFAPLCKPEYYTLAEVKRDLAKVKAIGLPLKKINITGGEPFLNKEIIDILLTVREAFPNLKMEVYTNAFLANSYSDEQFLLMKKAAPEFHVTEYGVYTEALRTVYEQFDKHDINYVVNQYNEEKKFFKKRIDFTGSVAPYEYINCQFYSFCYDLYMFDGVLYKCPLAMNIENINALIKQKIKISTQDYLQLSKVNSYDEIHKFWKSKLPLCRYCPSVTYDDVIPWKKSERKIEEWM